MMAATIIGCSVLPVRAQDEADWSFLLPVWSQLYTVSAGGGYKDNVTLSHASPEGGAFSSFSGDAFITRQFLDGSQLDFLFSANNRHYFEAESIDDEWTAFALARGSREFLDGSRGLLTLQYVFQDQVVDVSITETNRQSVRLTGHSLVFRPGFEPYTGNEVKFTLEFPIRRQWLREPLDHYWEVGPRFAVERDPGDKSETAAAYEINLRLYDSFQKLDGAGTSLPGTERILLRHNFCVDWRRDWDAEQHWRSKVRGGARVNLDNGSGYLDYTEFYGSADLRYSRAGWTLVGESRLSHYRFAKQTVFGDNTEKRERSDLTLSMRCERRIWRGASLVGEYEHEQVFGNDALDRYSADTVRGALQWEF